MANGKNPHKRALSAADAVVSKPVAWLRPYDRNSRTHGEEQVAKIARSIERFGFRNPIIAGDDGVIIAGHGRLLAAQLLGLENVPVIVAGGLTEEERRAYVIADNQIATDAGWDAELLKLELGELREADFDLTLIGFSDAQLAGILDVNLGGDADPEAAPEPPADAVSVRGDIWQLGRHRIICGDSTNAEDVAAVLAGAAPHLMVTDPPYGVQYDANWRNEAARKSPGMGNRAIGAGAIGKVMNDDRADWREAWALFGGDVAYVWCASLQSHKVADSLEATSFVLRSQIVWDKTRLIIGRSDYQWQHEPCWYAVRKGAGGRWNGDRKQTTIWSISHQKSETGHSTQKPVECMKRPIENNSKPGDAIYEPFSGSGTTIVAAEMTGRRCYAIELNPAYVDVAVQRWQTFTGEAATLVSTGDTFENTRLSRAAACAA